MSTDTDSPRTETVAGSGISDLPTSKDTLGFSPYVEALAAFLTHRDTKPPLTVSIEGPWGSGKSSFMLALREAIINYRADDGGKPKSVWFNAWRFDKEEALWGAFALAVTESLALSLPFWKRCFAHLQLQLRRFDWRAGWFKVFQSVVMVVFLSYVSVAVFRYVSSHLDALSPFSPQIERKYVGAQEVKPEEVLLRLLIAGAGGAGYILLSAMLLKRAFDVMGNPFKIELKKYSGNLNYEERVSFIQRFHADFGKIVRTYAGRERVFVFIDDLDRCELPKAAELMQAINLLLSDSDQIIYVLGLDRERIAAAFAAKFEPLLPYLNDQRSGSPTYSGIDFGFDFLEKFIQIPFRLPIPSTQDIDRLLNNLNGDDHSVPGTTASIANVDPGILFDTQNDSPLVRSIVKMVAPSLEYNPRRIKQFINSFRLAAIVASQTGLFGPPRNPSTFSQFTPEQLGKLIAISLRWPLLLRDAATMPDLLKDLHSGGTLASGTLALYWHRKAKLGELLAYDMNLGITGVVDSKYSLEKLDLERYLQVSPPIAIRKTRAATDRGTAQTPDHQDDKEFVHFDEEELSSKNDEDLIPEERPVAPEPTALRGSPPSKASEETDSDNQRPMRPHGGSADN